MVPRARQPRVCPGCPLAGIAKGWWAWKEQGGCWPPPGTGGMGWAAPAFPRKQEKGIWAPDFDVGGGSLRSLPLAGAKPPPTWARQCFFPGPVPLSKELGGWGCFAEPGNPRELGRNFKTPTFYSFIKHTWQSGKQTVTQRRKQFLVILTILRGPLLTT